MKKWKTYLSLLLILTLSVITISCGGNEDETEESTTLTTFVPQTEASSTSRAEEETYDPSDPAGEDIFDDLF